MNWYQKIAMPLPSADNYPPKPEDSYSYWESGIGRVDNNLSDKDIENMKNFQYLGHGSRGVAYKNDNQDKVVKITTDNTEANAAEHLMKNPCAGCAEVYEVSQINDNTWQLLIEKVDTASVTDDMISHVEDKLQSCNLSCWDIKTENIGLNKNNEPVLFDFGLMEFDGKPLGYPTWD